MEERNGMDKDRMITHSRNKREKEGVRAIYEAAHLGRAVLSASRSAYAVTTEACMTDELPQANISFAAKILPVLSEKENSVICLHGIVAVLAMAAEGASEDSLKEILTALEFDSMDELRESMLAVKENPCSAFVSKNSLKLNRGEDNLELLDVFKQIMANQYHAFIEEKGSVGESSLKLENIADFKAKWVYKMERDASHERRFYHADRTSSHPAFLSVTESLRYYKDMYDESVMAVALPYKVNDEPIPYEMILIDNKEPLTECELRRILTNMRNGKCEVHFPEFTIENNHNLIPAMGKIGLVNIFNEYVKAFDRIATKPLYAKVFRQQAKIEVDKEGTVAGAVTKMMVCKTLCMTPRVEKFNFNRPFNYFVRNTDTGEIIFVGKVNHLTDCERIKPEVKMAMPAGGIFSILANRAMSPTIMREASRICKNDNKEKK